MSTVLDTIQTQHATERVELLTREVVGSRTDLHWRYDVLDSQFSPVQFYAVALRGAGADAEEVLVIAIEFSMVKNQRGYFLVGSALITEGDGAILAEAESTAIEMPAPDYLRSHPERTLNIANVAQGVFDQMVDWVNGQSDLINRILRQAAA